MTAADRVGLALLVAGVGEPARDERQLPGEAHQPERDKEQARGALLPGVAQALERVPLQEVAKLVPDDGGQLRLVVHPEKQPRPDLHHSVGRHVGIEERVPDHVDADVGAMRSAETAEDARHVVAQRFVAHQEGAAPQALLLASHQRPQAAFVRGGVGGREPGRRAPLGRRGRGLVAEPPRSGLSVGGRGEQRAVRATGAQELAALHWGAGKPRRRTSTVSAALADSRRSPEARASRLNQRTRPLSRSTSDA